jgi:hypothetical protein
LSSLTPDLETVLITLRYADRDVKAAEKKKKLDARDLLFHIATVEGEKEVLPRSDYSESPGRLPQQDRYAGT